MSTSPRVSRWESIAAIAIHATKAKRGISSATIADTCDKLTRVATTLQRLYVARINGDNLKCSRCGGSKVQRAYALNVPCSHCKGEGRSTPVERATFDRRVVSAEKRATLLASALGLGIELDDNGGSPVKLQRMQGFGTFRYPHVLASFP